jgi:hypothetical protein
MFKPKTVLSIGLWMVFVYFLGVPSSWKFALYLLTGIFFIFHYALHFGRENFSAFFTKHGTSTFVENGDRKPGADLQKESLE